MNDDELRELVKVAFDVATHSLDFGSGWLDDAEVRSLRELAVWLGVDPVVATPYNFRSKYGIPTLRNRRGPSRGDGVGASSRRRQLPH